MGDRFRVERTDDAAEAWARAGPFLGRRPVEHNLALTILDQRRAQPQPGRYWSVVDQTDEVVGFALLSPLDFYALLASLPAPATPALAHAIAAEMPDLRGVNGEACTVATFGGQWSERLGVTVAAEDVLRLYRLDTAPRTPDAPGALRLATRDDEALMVSWAEAFQDELAGVPFPGDLAEVTRQRVAAGRIWLWDDGGPVSAVGMHPPLLGVSRIHYVYTPPEHRRRGYATACVSAVSAHALGPGGATTCVLYAQLGNATANGVYRSIGYRGGMEVLAYRFGSSRT